MTLLSILRSPAGGGGSALSGTAAASAGARATATGQKRALGSATCSAGARATASRASLDFFDDYSTDQWAAGRYTLVTGTGLLQRNATENTEEATTTAEKKAFLDWARSAMRP